MAQRRTAVVAELGRPETPDETASRKAESSRVYRSSQNTRNLVAALLVTLAVVAVIIFAVPRGAPPAAEPIDVAAVAQSISSAEGRTVLVPDVPEEWLVEPRLDRGRLHRARGRSSTCPTRHPDSSASRRASTPIRRGRRVFSAAPPSTAR